MWGGRLIKRDFFPSFLFLLLSLYVCRESIRLGFGKFNAPGPGFFSFLIGLSMGILSLTNFLEIALIKGFSEKDAMETASWKSIILTFITLLVFIVLLNKVGFILDTFFFLFFLCQVVGKKSWKICFLYAFGITISTYLLFQWLLKSQLPIGFLGF